MPSGDPRRHRRRGEEGYNLVLLMVLVTVLNILVAAALPYWTGLAQREKEEELIFRGLQYAEAIRVFQGRFGRPPMRLQELMEVEPRSIRQMWEDPMTGEAKWGLIFANAGVPSNTNQPPPDNELVPRQPEPDSRITSDDEDTRTTGPIVGVYSLAEGDAMKVFNGKERYSEWHFTVDLLLQAMGMGQQQGNPQQTDPNPPRNGDDNRSDRQQPDNRGLGNPMPTGPPDLSSRWIGRPWPPQIEAQMNPAGQLQGGGMPGQPGPADLSGGNSRRNDAPRRRR